MFCNSRKAVDESTADLTVFLTLGILRDYSRLHISMREGRWRGGLAPVQDPAGLTLGLVGCGAIGKVGPTTLSGNSPLVAVFLLTQVLARCTQGQRLQYEDRVLSADSTSGRC